MSSNPYEAPKTTVADYEAAQEYSEVKIWSASGRIGRLRYLAYSTGAWLVAGLVFGVLAAVMDYSLAVVVAAVLYIAALVLNILAAIQRSHDMDWSGWTILLTFIPLAGLIWVFKPGSPGVNTYGAPPPPNTLGVKILGLILPVVFIVGVLAAIAIPAYVDYQKRAAGEYEQSYEDDASYEDEESYGDEASDKGSDEASDEDSEEESEGETAEAAYEETE